MSHNEPNQGDWDPIINPTAQTMVWPGGLFLADGKLYLADYKNNRALVYDPIPVSNNPSASLVIGQPDMNSNSPNHDPSGQDPKVPYADSLYRPDDINVSSYYLMVADAFNNRSVRYFPVPQTDSPAADVVIGQVAANGRLLPNQGGDPGPSTVNEPRRIVVYDGKVFIADRLNSRVLIFNDIPAFNNATASVVLGQLNFYSGDANRGEGNPLPGTLSEPCGVFVRRGRLFITDTGNNRILVFNQIPEDMSGVPYSADVVLGQADFYSGQANRGQSYPGPNTLSKPFGSVYYDGSRLFVCDNDNHRVLIFNDIPRDMNGPAESYSADVVLGQPDMYHNLVNQVDPDPPPDPPSEPTARTLYWPDAAVLHQPE
jgi:hypothetical protein